VTPPTETVVVTVTPYDVQLSALNKRWAVSLSPEDASALVIQLVAAIKTVTQPGGGRVH